METNDGNEFAPQAATSEAKRAVLLAIREQYKHDSCDNQRRRMLEALRHFPISTFEARRYLDVMHPAGRVQELRELGHDITTLRLSEPSEVGKPHCIAVYLLRKEAGEMNLDQLRAAVLRLSERLSWLGIATDIPGMSAAELEGVYRFLIHRGGNP